MVKNIYNIEYQFTYTDKNRGVVTGGREDLNYLASSMKEAEMLLKKDIRRLYDKSEKPKVKVLKIKKGVKGVLRSSNVFNVPNNVNINKLLK